MKSVLKVGLFIVALVSFSVNAQVTASDSVHLKAKEAVSSVFHVTMPDNSVLTLSVNGSDRFSSAIENSASVSSEIDGKAAYFKFSKPGHYSVGANTICGVAFSVAVHVYSKEEAREKQISGSLPKVVVDAPEVCHL